MAYGVPQISPWEAQGFATQRASARRRLMTGRAQSQYQRSLAGLDYGANRQNLTRQYNAQRETLPTSYIQRGVFNSGIYRSGLEKYAQERLGAFNELQRGYQKQLGGLTFGERDLEDTYAEALAQIQAQEFARRAQTAAQLRSVL